MDQVCLRPGHLRPVYIGAEIYAQTSFPPPHPLAIPRASAVEALCRALGWLGEDYRTSPVASLQDLARYHDPAYIAAVAEADRAQGLDPDKKRLYQIGIGNNPIFPGMFARAASAAGGSALAARLAIEGRLVMHPPGGMHHAGRARASGFCFFNDCVLAILEFLGQGAQRVAYVDFDAHHGDGVEDAFADDPRVLTISIHEENRWPRTGLLGERRGGGARNLPVPRGLNDDEFAFLQEEAVLPMLQAFRPQALVIVTGADALAGDPLARLSLSNGALWRAVEAVAQQAPASVVLGGGGYNPWNVARAWAGLWGRLSGRVAPDVLPEAAQAVLVGLGRNPPPGALSNLLDVPRPGHIRHEIRRVAQIVRDA